MEYKKMKEITVEYWTVECPDGGGMQNVTIANFASKHDAIFVADYLSSTRKWPHSVPNKSTVKTFKIFVSAEEYFAVTNRENIRKQALSKLTDEERKALGV